MITTKTVLVLGAGASAPYGYPTGRELKQLIIRQLNRGSGNPWRHLLYEAGESDIDIDKFQEALNLCGLPSVDRFLELNPHFKEIGQLLIAYGILSQENDTHNGFWGQDDLNWYEYLYGKLSAPLNQFKRNELSIVTFNYDRSLEHCLYNYIKFSHGQASEAADAIRNIPIIHLYGQLGLLPWQKQENEKTRAYMSAMENPAGVDWTAKKIEILAEKQETSEAFNQAFMIMNAASRIYFLGFGYSDINMRRLRIDALDGGKSIIGTCYKMGKADAREVRRKWPAINELVDAPVLAFLKDHTELN